MAKTKVQKVKKKLHNHLNIYTTFMFIFDYMKHITIDYDIVRKLETDSISVTMKRVLLYHVRLFTIHSYIYMCM